MRVIELATGESVHVLGECGRGVFDRIGERDVEDSLIEVLIEFSGRDSGRGTWIIKGRAGSLGPQERMKSSAP